MYLFSNVPNELISLFRAVGSFAETCGGGRAYLIGSFPIAMFLKEQVREVEISIAGNMLFVADEFEKAYGVEIKEENDCETKCLLPSPYSKDCIHLTQAVDGNIKKEIFSRAFSVDALTIELGHENFGRFFDPGGAISDLKSMVLRALQRDVFIKDPVNILRAVKLLYRYQLSMDPITEELLKGAIESELLKNIADSDISLELDLIKKEKHSKDVLQTLKDMKII
jgi:hypothetical protein